MKTTAEFLTLFALAMLQNKIKKNIEARIKTKFFFIFVIL
tara:strand:- start:282 stop:401 length:120 start_codon:yes stop_codon:yes gene_type:complete